MNDRIKLAEAMGWKIISHDFPEGPMTRTVDGVVQIRKLPPDPENNANDDYAVLEWMRDKFFEGGILRYGEWTKAINSVIPYSRDYRIGDYARAALKVIE